MDNKQYNALFSFIWNIANDMLVRKRDRQVAQITFNDDIIDIVAGMLEEKTGFVFRQPKLPELYKCTGISGSNESVVDMIASNLGLISDTGIFSNNKDKMY